MVGVGWDWMCCGGRGGCRMGLDGLERGGWVVSWE